MAAKGRPLGPGRGAGAAKQQQQQQAGVRVVQRVGALLLVAARGERRALQRVAGEVVFVLR